MKALILGILILFALQTYSQVSVRGYYRKDGTYVQPHYRSNPDGNPYNNWSYPGNVNPYTGKIASGDPATYLNSYYNRSKSNSSSTYSNPSSSTTSPKYSSPSYSYPNSRQHYGSSEYGAENSMSNSSYLYYVSSTKLNVRSGPATSHNVITTLEYQDRIDVIATSEYPWYKIKLTYYDSEAYNFKTSYGYVHSSNITYGHPGVRSNNVYLPSYDNIGNSKNSYSSNVARPIPLFPFGEGKGKITIWTDCTDDGNISVYIDGAYAGEITHFFNSRPDCGTFGTLSIIKPSGKYKVKAEGATRIWEGYISVICDECILQKLSKRK